VLSRPSRIAVPIRPPVALSDRSPSRKRQLLLMISEMGYPVTFTNASEHNWIGLSGFLTISDYKIKRGTEDPLYKSIHPNL
jgi:hypothetical protein